MTGALIMASLAGANKDNNGEMGRKGCGVPDMRRLAGSFMLTAPLAALARDMDIQED